MQSEIQGAPAFAYIHVDLEPGESVLAESDAMASMATDLDMRVRFNGGNILTALLKKWFGGESFFVNEFKNNSSEVKRVTLAQGTPGNLRQVELNGSALCLQPGAYIASTPGIKLGLSWAGFASFFGREGLFRLKATGTGNVWFGAYGELVEKNVEGDYIVDTAHLVAYFQVFLAAKVL
jgi:uncharacterized protein (TIGR00266 family)